MSQNDLVIANQSFPATRADINSALQALGSLSSGATAPSTTYANMLWYDTANNILKMRSEADDAWISVGYLNQSTDEFSLFDDTKVVNSSGTQTGIIGDQATSAWETGTSTTESLVSPAKVKAAAKEVVSDDSLGYNQTWVDLLGSRSPNTWYQNTTGRPIFVAMRQETTGEAGQVQVSVDTVTTVEVGLASAAAGVTNTFIVPPNWYYRTEDGSAITQWSELR